MILKTDGWDIGPISGTAQYDGGKQTARLWFNTASGAVAVGDFVAVFATDTGNPGAIDGETYHIADSDVIDAAYDTVGVALEAMAITQTGFLQVQISGRYVGANVDSNASVANGDPLCIGGTAGRAIEQVLDASTTANRRTIAICRSTPSNNTADVDLIRHPHFAGP